MKQPLVAVALLYGAGVVLGHFLEGSLRALFVAEFALIALALFAARVRSLLLPAAIFLFGWLNMTTRTAVISPHDLRSALQDHEAIIFLEGRIADAPSQRIYLRNGVETSHTLAELEVTAVRPPRGQWQPAFGRLMSRTAGVLPSEFVAGQTIELTGIAQPPDSPMAEGVFDYRRYLNSRGIYYELKVDGPRDWKLSGPSIAVPLAERFRTWAQRTLARGLPEQDESLRLQWAMLLGWKTALTSEVSEPFMRSGTMHIFAISGLHIALIAGIFVALLRAATLPRLACGLLVIPIIWFYTAATGWQASAIRSTVMMTVIIAGWSLKRPPDLLNSLAMAACVVLVWQPEQLFQAGFQLSFFVVLSIALLTPPIEKFRQRYFALDPLLPFDLRPRWQRSGLKLGGTVWKWFATSLAAFIGSVPLIAYYFHLFTPGSLLANLVVVPVSSLALMSGLGAMVTGDWLPFATEWFNHAGWAFMWLMIWLSESVANLPAAWCHVRAPSAILFTLYYGLLIAMCAGWFAKRWLRWSIMGTAAALAALAFLQWREQRSWHRITVLPLNGAPAVYVQPASGEREWLINCGDRGAVEFTLKPFLQARGTDRLANLVLTHGEARHVSGATLLHKLFPVWHTCVSPINFRSPRYREVVAGLETTSRLQRSATNGFTFAPWTILHPNPSDRFTSAEDHAIVALGTFDGVRVLLVPGLGKAGQNAIFTRHPDLRADIVIAGWPDKGELAVEWLEAIRPKLIVITDPEVPRARQTSGSIIQRFNRVGAAVLAGDKTGAITLSIREGKWRMEKARPASD